MKALFIMLFALMTISGANAQPCFPEGISFATQSQINSFRIDYPGCTQVQGDLIIAGYNITNLSGLNVLTGVGGNLIIECNEVLANLNGLDNIVAVGEDIFIEGNFALTNISALRSINYLGGDLIITDNPALTGISGLEGLAEIPGTLWVEDNPVLQSLSGLDNLVFVQETVRISNNQALQTMAGLGALQFIGGSLVIGGMGHMGGIGNNALVSVAELIQLTSIGGDLDVGCNQMLTSLSGLDNIVPGSIQNLNIYLNPMLSTCEVQSVCGYLASPTGSLDISGNMTGCATPEEVESACVALGFAGPAISQAFRLYPNPASESFHIELPVTTQPVELTIVNSCGKVVIRQMVNGPRATIAIGNLPEGIYFLRTVDSRSSWSTKFVRN